jgi:hypothetical protein
MHAVSSDNIASILSSQVLIIANQERLGAVAINISNRSTYSAEIGSCYALFLANNNASSLEEDANNGNDSKGKRGAKHLNGTSSTLRNLLAWFQTKQNEPTFVV